MYASGLYGQDPRIAQIIGSDGKAFGRVVLPSQAFATTPSNVYQEPRISGSYGPQFAMALDYFAQEGVPISKWELSRFNREMRERMLLNSDPAFATFKYRPVRRNELFQMLESKGINYDGRTKWESWGNQIQYEKTRSGKKNLKKNGYLVPTGIAPRASIRDTKEAISKMKQVPTKLAVNGTLLAPTPIKMGRRTTSNQASVMYDYFTIF